MASAGKCITFEKLSEIFDAVYQIDPLMLENDVNALDFVFCLFVLR